VQLVTLNLPDGYANLSLKALRKLLPFMEQGLRYDQARIAAGYTYHVEESELKDRLPPPPSIRNPIVQKALFEVRRVVNAVIATYGKPDAIRIELPRELTMNKAQKVKYLKQQTENTKANDRADKCYQQIREQNPHLKLPERSAKDDRLKYRLWEEQKHFCLYTGKQISLTELFSSAVEVDHILPYKRTVNDSYMNKAVVMATANREKGNRTPYEAYSGDAVRYEQIVQRASHLPLPKRKAVLQAELASIDDFINSQLTDTAYISREVKDYMACLGCDVSVTKGGITAWLRRQCGLNTVLGGEVKNREDHRHHAIDATVTALTSRRLYHAIVHAAERQKDIHIDEPWPKFREELIGRLSSVIVSHAPVRKLVGAFHEETGYGVQDNDTGGKRVVYRKTLDEKFDLKQIAKVIDPHLQEMLRDHLARFNNDPKQAFNESNRPSYGVNQAPLRHVRIVSADNFNERSYLVVKDVSGKPYRYHPFGNNHHVEIVRSREKGRVTGKFVNTWEAATRVRRDRGSLIQTDHGADWEFLMALCISDTVSLSIDGVIKYFRVQNLDPDGGRIVLREHTAATLENDNQKVRKSIAGLINEMNMTLVQVSPLGHIRHDQANN
jgi:CRISPR-associated endonuclease Csn1